MAQVPKDTKDKNGQQALVKIKPSEQEEALGQSQTQASQGLFPAPVTKACDSNAHTYLWGTKH